MVQILKLGKSELAKEITCAGCNSTLGVYQADWKKGDYGSERYINCPVCKGYIVQPGTEYRGDF
jgi:ribosomal protein S27E